LISGTPAASGTVSVTLGATNWGGTGNANLSIVFTVNFSALVGSYDGVGAVGGTDRGLFTITISNNGSFSAKLATPGGSYPMKGAFASTGGFTGAFKIGQAYILAALQADPAGPMVTGSVTVETTSTTSVYDVSSGLLGSFTASTIPAGLAGAYTVIFPSEDGTSAAIPNAPGFATMTVLPTGSIHLSGKLGDGSTVNTRARLHADGKSWTFYQSLYAGHNPGSVAGAIAFASSPGSDAEGPVDWIKPAQTSGTRYPGGFTGSTELLAAKTKVPALSSGTGSITFTGGDLPTTITDPVTVLSSGRISVGGNNGVTASVNATGSLTGSFRNPATGKKTTFTGVIYQKPAPAGFGLFLGTDQTGSVQISQ
jgi:hypothetical protein